MMDEFLKSISHSITNDVLKSYSTTLTENIMNEFRNKIKGSDDYKARQMDSLDKALVEKYKVFCERNEKKRKEEEHQRQINEARANEKRLREENQELKEENEELRREPIIIQQSSGDGIFTHVFKLLDKIIDKAFTH